jgi:hypothetical protein
MFLALQLTVKIIVKKTISFQQRVRAIIIGVMIIRKKSIVGVRKAS